MPGRGTLFYLALLIMVQWYIIKMNILKEGTFESGLQ